MSAYSNFSWCYLTFHQNKLFTTMGYMILVYYNQEKQIIERNPNIYSILMPLYIYIYIYIYRFQCIHYIGTCIAIKIFEWILYGFTRASNDVYMDRYIFFSCYLSCPKDIIPSNQGCYTTTSLSRGMFYLSVHLP